MSLSGVTTLQQLQVDQWEACWNPQTEKKKKKHAYMQKIFPETCSLWQEPVTL